MTRTPMPMPRSVGTVGMWLFLAALSMLFGASLLGYAFIRIGGPPTLTAQKLHFPWLLWLSTALVLGVSYALHRALNALRLERQDTFHAWLQSTLALSFGFLIVQTPAMAMLLSQHNRLRNSTNGTHIYGLIFTLVLLHALHVVGGVIALLRVWYVARRDGYDHEHFLPVRHVAMYWHFLDIIWLLMFGTFLALG